MGPRGAFLAAALFAGTSYLQAGTETAESYYKCGLKLERVRSYDAAASFYAAAIAKDPLYPPALKELGNCHYYLGDTAQAYKDYQAYLLLKPDDHAISTLSAKLAPPKPLPTPGASSNPDLFFQEPGWQLERVEERERALGKFRAPRKRVFQALAVVLESLNAGTPLGGSAQGELHTPPFLLNPLLLRPASSTPNGGLAGLGEMHQFYRGGPMAYSLQAVGIDRQTFVQVRWILYRNLDAVKTLGELGGATIVTGEKLSDEEREERDVKALEDGRKAFQERGLPRIYWILSQDIDQKLQRDWNWRLWQQLQAVPEGKGSIEVKGWEAPTATFVGYNLYMGELSGGASRKVNDKAITGLSYRIENLVPGKKYYFVLTALTDKGEESRQSQEWSLPALADTK